MEILLAINHILPVFTTYTDLSLAQKSTKILKTKFILARNFESPCSIIDVSQHFCSCLIKLPGNWGKQNMYLLSKTYHPEISKNKTQNAHKRKPKKPQTSKKKIKINSIPQQQRNLNSGIYFDFHREIKSHTDLLSCVMLILINFILLEMCIHIQKISQQIKIST